MSNFYIVHFRQTPSLKVQDYDPGYALRKIALLYEKNQNEEVARLIGDLSSTTLNKIYSDFPIDMFIEGIPLTMSIVNALYSRIFSEVRMCVLKKVVYVLNLFFHSFAHNYFAMQYKHCY